MKRIAKENKIGLIVGKKYKVIKYRFDDFYISYPGENAFKKCELDTFFEPKQKKDKIVSQVVNKFKERSKIGIKKYGTTLHENNTDDFFNHLQEELMDAILYLQKLKNNDK